MTREYITGLVAPPHTPMRPDFSVDLDKIAEQWALLSKADLAGLFICGTTGEGLALSTTERMRVAERWKEVTPKGMRLIIHVGHTSISECKTLAAHARDIGAFGMAVIGPYFWKPTTVEDLARFCGEVATAAPELPIYYYHLPALSGVYLPMYDFLKLAGPRIPSLFGMKFTYENVMDFARCVRLENGRYNMLFGRDEILLAGLTLGAHGAIGSTYNFAAPLYHRLLTAFRSGDLETARTWQAKAQDMIAILHKFGGQPAGKAVMKLIGLDLGPLRPPLRDLTDEERHRLRAELEAIGFFEYCLRP